VSRVLLWVGVVIGGQSLVVFFGGNLSEFVKGIGFPVVLIRGRMGVLDQVLLCVGVVVLVEILHKLVHYCVGSSRKDFHTIQYFLLLLPSTMAGHHPPSRGRVVATCVDDVVVGGSRYDFPAGKYFHNHYYYSDFPFLSAFASIY
jgi:hypothetical protein